MDWMNNLFAILMLTTATGTIFYLLVLVFRQIWSRNDIKVLRIQMRIMQWAFLLPCVYFILYLRERISMSTSGGDINLFYNTPSMRMLGAALACGWLDLFLVVFVDKLNTRYEWMKLFCGNIPEESAETQKIFDEICVQLGISGKILLHRNDLLKMPCITYNHSYHGFAVVLPLECYTKKETAVILYHELCHYLNHDLFIGTTSCIVSLLHVFNPLVPKILKQMNLVCEEYCDQRACQEGSKMFSEKEYFRTILKFLEEEGKRERYNLFMLADTISDYERRVQCMKRYHEYGGFKKGMSRLLSACFLLGSSSIALIAGDSMTKGYTAVAEATDNRTVDNEAFAYAMETAEPMSDTEGLKEFRRMYDLDSKDVIIMGEDDIEPVGGFTGIDWKLAPGKTGIAFGSLKKGGETISIMTVGDSDNIVYQMGIKDPEEYIRYVEGIGHLSCEFSIKIDGEYYFFVTNLDKSRELKVKGTIIK